jgi:hypothetical protein
MTDIASKPPERMISRAAACKGAVVSPVPALESWGGARDRGVPEPEYPSPCSNY